MKAIDFLKECGVFYVLTVDNNGPVGRPFGAIMEYDECLYIATNKSKNVYKQLLENSNVQIVAIKNQSRDWIRVSGVAEECTCLKMKDRMFKECPRLLDIYGSSESEQFALFKIDVKHVEFN